MTMARNQVLLVDDDQAFRDVIARGLESEDEMVVKEAPATPAGEAQRLSLVCRHHWLIEPNDRPVSRGFCSYCHEMREFKNFIGGDSLEQVWREAGSGERTPTAASPRFRESFDEF